VFALKSEKPGQHGRDQETNQELELGIHGALESGPR
jgi:hypothetical protein